MEDAFILLAFKFCSEIIATARLRLLNVDNLKIISLASLVVKLVMKYWLKKKLISCHLKKIGVMFFIFFDIFSFFISITINECKIFRVTFRIDRNRNNNIFYEKLLPI